MKKVAEGDLAPDFDLPTDGGGRFKLSDLRGKTVVLYFYPKDDTEGCTIEAIDFTARRADFAAAGAVVVGVSRDTPKSHDRFKAKHDLAVILASDVERQVVERYGVWVEKSMFGRNYMGVERDTFLIAPDGKISRVWRKVRVRGHVEDVLVAAQAL
jgi:peroxiredoxin Q/BCP